MSLSLYWIGFPHPGRVPSCLHSPHGNHTTGLFQIAGIIRIATVVTSLAKAIVLLLREGASHRASQLRHCPLHQSGLPVLPNSTQTPSKTVSTMTKLANPSSTKRRETMLAPLTSKPPQDYRVNRNATPLKK